MIRWRTVVAPMLIQRREDHVAILSLNDPTKRNALSMAMFDALDAALETLRRDAGTRVILLRGEGPAFCAGFDLGAAVEHPAVMSVFIERLSTLLRAIRRLPQPVVASVHGAAVAGGCAVVSACDLVFVESSTKLGYPVHRIGLSPAVTLPTLIPKVGDGAARALVMSGELIDGATACRIGLASHVISGEAAMGGAATDFARGLAAKPPGAVRATKAWLNELDGSLADDHFDLPARDSARFADDPASVELLRAAWRRGR